MKSIKPTAILIFILGTSLPNALPSDSINEGRILNNTVMQGICFRDVEFNGEKYVCETTTQAGQQCQGDALGFFCGGKLIVYKVPNQLYKGQETGHKCVVVAGQVQCGPKTFLHRATLFAAEMYEQIEHTDLDWGPSKSAPVVNEGHRWDGAYGMMEGDYFFDLMGGIKDFQRNLNFCPNNSPENYSLVVLGMYTELNKSIHTCDPNLDLFLRSFENLVIQGTTSLDVIQKYYQKMSQATKHELDCK